MGSSNKATLLVSHKSSAPKTKAASRRLLIEATPNALTRLAAPRPIKPIRPTSLTTKAVTTATISTTNARIPIIGTPKRLACESSRLIKVNGFNKGRQTTAITTAVIASIVLVCQLFCAKNPAAHDSIPLLRSAKNNTKTLATAASRMFTTKPANIKMSGLKRLGADNAKTSPILISAPTKDT